MNTANIKINKSLKRVLIHTLAQAFTDLKNIDETLLFMKDFFTDAELEALSKRLAVAYYLNKKRTYENIKTNLKVSTSTIAEISTLIQKDGVRLALKKIEAEEWANKWAKKIQKLKLKI